MPEVQAAPLQQSSAPLQSPQSEHALPAHTPDAHWNEAHWSSNAHGVPLAPRRVPGWQLFGSPLMLLMATHAMPAQQSVSSLHDSSDGTQLPPAGSGSHVSPMHV